MDSLLHLSFPAGVHKLPGDPTRFGSALSTHVSAHVLFLSRGGYFHFKQRFVGLYFAGVCRNHGEASSAIRCRRCSFQQYEHIFIVIENSVLLHCRQFSGQSTSIGTKIVRKFHSSQPDVDALALLCLRLQSKIGQNFFPKRFLEMISILRMSCTFLSPIIRTMFSISR